MAVVDHDGEQITFSDAMTELKSILDELESDEVDIDRLATSVRRAATLIGECRRRVVAVEMEIDQIVLELDESDGDPGPP